MAIPRGTPAKLSIDMALDAAASQAFKASPLLKMCIGPSPAVGKESGAMQEAWPRLAAAVVAAAAERVRRSGVFKRRSTVMTTVMPQTEKTLEGVQPEAWTLVDDQEQGELAA
eukprot:scaffold61002_cov64-Phaeocystis_antarctica.AAC.1